MDRKDLFKLGGEVRFQDSLQNGTNNFQATGKILEDIEERLPSRDKAFVALKRQIDDLIATKKLPFLDSCYIYLFRRKYPVLTLNHFLDILRDLYPLE